MNFIYIAPKKEKEKERWHYSHFVVLLVSYPLLVCFELTPCPPPIIMGGGSTVIFNDDIITYDKFIADSTQFIQLFLSNFGNQYECND